MTSTASCLRTEDATKAKLFFVPFLPSVFRHATATANSDEQTHTQQAHTSIYEESLAQAMTGISYENWERYWGLTSTYWKRRQGKDHVVVMPEPLHGLYHPRGKRGFHHYIKTQKQLTSSIVISVELSKTFIETYPQCSTPTNILMPYPNIDQRWYNGYWDEKVFQIKQKQKLQLQLQQQRPFFIYYDGGNHGECLSLRKALRINYECEREQQSRFLFEFGSGTSGTSDSSSGTTVAPPSPLPPTLSRNSSYPLGMRMATFCPCPGGDSPSAKRMFDAVLAGCIPVILSYDFVWPFSTTTTTTSSSSNATGQQQQQQQQDLPLLDITEFAIHLDASKFSSPIYYYNENHHNEMSNNNHCKRIPTTNEENNKVESLQEYLKRTVSSQQIMKLQQGLQKAAKLYSFFQPQQHQQKPSSPATASDNNNPLLQGILPSGGAAIRLVQELAKRAATETTTTTTTGTTTTVEDQWKKCQEEKVQVLQQTKGKMVKENKC